MPVQDSAFRSAFGRTNEVNASSRSAAFDAHTDADRLLFLKVFSGEVLAAFKRNTVFDGLTMTRTIPNGKSAQFPRLGRAKARRHQPGTHVLGQGNRIPAGEMIIYLDDLLLADTFIADIDEAMAHFDVRGQYAIELGEALSNEYDRNICKTLFKAAASAGGAITNNWSRIVSTSTVTAVSSANETVTLSAADAAFTAGTVVNFPLISGGYLSATIASVSTATYTLVNGSYAPGQLDELLIGSGSNPFRHRALDSGTSITGIDVTTADYAALSAACFTAAQRLDEKDVPAGGRALVVTPEIYYKLVQGPRAINADFNAGTQNGTYAQGRVFNLAGFKVYASNTLVDLAAEGNIARATGERNDYSINMTKAIGIAFHGSAAGTLKLKGIESQLSGNDTAIQYQGTLMVSRMLCGHGILRPEAAVSMYAA